MSEMVKNWLIELYEREIKEALGSVSNERIWLMGTDVWGGGKNASRQYGKPQ
mgnify:CR=1 FL=1